MQTYPYALVTQSFCKGFEAARVEAIEVQTTKAASSQQHPERTEQCRGKISIAESSSLSNLSNTFVQGLGTRRLANGAVRLPLRFIRYM